MEHTNGNEPLKEEKLTFRIGRRKSDPLVIVDLHKKRAHFDFNAAWLEGIYLEDIDPGPFNRYPCKCLIQKEWDNCYFVRKRESEEWTEDAYFELATRLMWKKGITKP